MNVLGFGTYESAKHPRMLVLLHGLRAAGDAVHELNAPITFSTAQRVELLRRPWGAYPFVTKLLSRWSRLAHRATHHRDADVVLVGYLGHLDVHLARILYPRKLIALDHLTGIEETAVDRGLSTGPRALFARLVDRAALHSADVVLVDTQEHHDQLPPGVRGNAVVVPVGADNFWFRAAASAPPIDDSPLRVIFFGLFTPLQGASVIGEAISMLRDQPIQFTMVGRGQDQQRAKALAAEHPRVAWIDWLKPAELAAAVASHHVCLGIFGTGRKARSVVPNKVFQGAAAGCAVVTSDTGPQRRLLREAAVYVPPGDAAELAAALRELAHDPARVRQIQNMARSLAEREFTPAAVVVPLREALLRRLGASA